MCAHCTPKELVHTAGRHPRLQVAAARSEQGDAEAKLAAARAENAKLTARRKAEVRKTHDAGLSRLSGAVRAAGRACSPCTRGVSVQSMLECIRGSLSIFWCNDRY